MQFEWILNPITQYAVIAAAILGSLLLFVCIKVEVRRIERKSFETADANLQKLSAEVQAIRETMQKAKDIEVSPKILRGLNLSKRSQAIRMHRRGESIHSISAALQTPKNEIELVLKVNQLLSSSES